MKQRPIRKVTRATFLVTVDLDAMEGAMHTPESAQNVITGVLCDRLGHYLPVVIMAPDNFQPED